MDRISKCCLILGLALVFVFLATPSRSEPPVKGLKCTVGGATCSSWTGICIDLTKIGGCLCCYDAETTGLTFNVCNQKGVVCTYTTPPVCPQSCFLSSTGCSTGSMCP
jgi:hypothetical protein